MIYKTLIERLQERNDIKPCVYARVSTRKQLSKGFSIENQEDRGSQALEWYDIQTNFPLKLYVDGAVSGSNTDRNDLIQMKRDIEDGIINLVIVTAADRVGREFIGNFEFKDFLIKNKAEMLFTNNPSLDIYSVEGEFQYGLDSILGQRELREIRRRAEGGIIKSFESGNYATPGVPYGYNKIKNKNKKGFKLKVNEEKSEVVKLIHELYLRKNMNVEKLVIYLNIHEVDSSIKWDHHKVRRILRNPVYCDIIVRNDLNKVFSGLGIAPMIVGIDEKKEIRRLLGERARSHSNSNKHIFYEMVYCEKCKNRCTNDTSKQIYRYYHCKTCKARFPEKQLEEVVSQIILEYEMKENGSVNYDKMKRELKKVASVEKSLEELLIEVDMPKVHIKAGLRDQRKKRREILKKYSELEKNNIYWFNLSIRAKQKKVKKLIESINIDIQRGVVNDVKFREKR